MDVGTIATLADIVIILVGISWLIMLVIQFIDCWRG